MGFIKTVLIILFIYQGFKVLARFFAPFLMRYAAKKVQEKFKGQMGQQMGGFDQQNKPTPKEGCVFPSTISLERLALNVPSL